MTTAPRLHRESSTPAYSRALHWAAILTACAVFPLIFVGASVTSKKAGMAYADGFTSNGYLLRNPPGWWQRDDTRWEHGHRLLGRIVGILAIVVAIGAWRRGRFIRLLGLASLAAIVTQGVLGALRVYEVSTMLAMIHGITGQLCFCLACTVALVTGRMWAGHSQTIEVSQDGFVRRLFMVSTLLVFLQLGSGAAFRHFGSDVALMVHAFGAMLVTCLAGWSAMWLIGGGFRQRWLVRLGWAVAILLVLQLLLGGFAFTVTVMGGAWSPLVHWVVPSAHVAVGALLLASLFVATVGVYRMVRSVTRSTPVETPASVATL